MRVYVSADIEGVTGTVHWSETDRSNAEYADFREQMTAEVAAACEGALAGGATEILVKDAHATARNVIASRLPKEARLVRGWSGHPFLMVEGIDATYHALVMVGYHSRAGSDASPLAHTISGNPAHIRLNDAYVSEMLLHAWAAASVSVPLVFVSGDAGICRDAEALDPRVTTVAVKEGLGSSVTSIHPALATERIRDGTRSALRRDWAGGALPLPKSFELEISYRDHARAFAASFFPGFRQVDPRTLRLETASYFEVLRALAFVIRS